VAFIGCRVLYPLSCLAWPPQAAEWTTRRKEHNWPDAATINRVVHNGCDVVQVAHPWCRENELMNSYQWRLSFSRAETVLLNTWLPTQQLVYHMLRVFVSTIQFYHGLSVIKRYHIKTLLLWMCELYPQLWNTNCVVNICTQVLHELAKWLMSAEFPMYFVTQCNLLDVMQCNANEIESFVRMLNNLTDDCLSWWFFNIYIRRYASQYPHIASSFDVISSSTDLQRVLTVVSNERQRGFNHILYADFEQVHFELQYVLWKLQLLPSIESRRLIVEQLQSIDSRFIDFVYALCLLRCVLMLE